MYFVNLSFDNNNKVMICTKPIIIIYKNICDNNTKPRTLSFYQNTTKISKILSFLVY